MARAFLAGVQGAQKIRVWTPGTGGTTLIPLTTVTNVDSRGGLAIPAAVLPGTSVRCKILVTAAAAASTNTISARFGTANTNADTAIFSTALTIGTAAAGSALVTWDVFFLTATTAMAMVTTALGTTTNGFSTANQDLGTTAPVAIATTSASFLGFYISSTVSNNITVRDVSYEVIAS